MTVTSNRCIRVDLEEQLERPLGRDLEQSVLQVGQRLGVDLGQYLDRLAQNMEPNTLLRNEEHVWIYRPQLGAERVGQI